MSPIKQDVKEELEAIIKMVLTFLKPENGYSKVVYDHLTYLLKSEVSVRVKTLADTQINYLMKSTKDDITGLSIAAQNEFYDANFRGEMEIWVRNNPYHVIPPILTKPSMMKRLFSPVINLKEVLSYKKEIEAYFTNEETRINQWLEDLASHFTEEFNLWKNNL